MCHDESDNGFQIIAHNPNIKGISERIQDIKKDRDKTFKYTVYSGHSRKGKSFITESEFEERCTEYFEIYYECLARRGPLILSWEARNCPKYLENLTLSMRSWCEKTNTPPNIQGLVLPSFSILKHLHWHGLNPKMISNYLQTEKIPSELSAVVYNSQKSVILLIRKAKSEKLTNDIASLINYLKLFILLFDNVLPNIKFIPLVVTDDNVNPDYVDCHDCRNHVLSEKELRYFSNWLGRREQEEYFNIGNNKIKEDLGKSNVLKTRFLAKVTGVLAAASIHPNHMPRLIGGQSYNKQMEHVKVLLTPAQLDIIHSQDKHVIIKGGFGCGKSIIAAAMLKKIAESLKNDEKLFHICYDAKSEMLNEIGTKSDKVTPFHNKDGLLLSTVIDQITKPDRSEKINLVVDEYDGEDLNKAEADKLNKVFNESLKESYIVLIRQPIEKERHINDVPQEKNRFDILKKDRMKADYLHKWKEGTMIEYHLALNMRNSKEIYELVEATKEELEKQTIFFHPKDSKIDDESEERKENKIINKSKENQESKESLEENSISKEEISENEGLEDEPEFETKGQLVENQSNSKMGNHGEDIDSSGENAMFDELEVEPEFEIKEHSVEDYSNTKMSLDGAEAVKGLSIANRKKNEDGSVHKDHQKLEEEHKSKGQSLRKHGDSLMGLDEAQAIIGSPMRNDAVGNRTVSTFEHAEVDSIGHKMETGRPLLFELGDTKEEFQKSLSLVTILSKMLLDSNKHVVLHLDTETNAFPSAIQFAFHHHFKDMKKTTNFEEFQSSDKSIFKCSYRKIRGLEFARVTVLIDRDIYFVQHYLVETLARCTTKLSVVVLPEISALDNVIKKWKAKELLNQWKTKIVSKKNQTKHYEFQFNHEEKIAYGKFKFDYYERLEKEFNLPSKNENTASFRKDEAMEIVIQR